MGETENLNKNLKDLLSQNKNNIKIINNTLEKKEKYKKIFELTFREWIDLFLMKKESKI